MQGPTETNAEIAKEQRPEGGRTGRLRRMVALRAYGSSDESDHKRRLIIAAFVV